MLGDIQSDLSKQGVTTKTKGLCGACNQPVIGQVMFNFKTFQAVKQVLKRLLSFRYTYKRKAMYFFGLEIS